MKHQLTLKWMEEQFDKYNKLYWGGKLRKPTFEISHTKTVLGQFCFKNQWKLRISDRFDREEKDYTNTLLHEMIHLYIRQNGIRDTNKHHGQVFYREADRINQFGWNISRTNSVEGCGLSNKSKEVYHVAAMKDARGKYFTMCMNPKKVSFFKRCFEDNNDFYREWFVFTSNDDKKYACWSKCIKSCRGYFITHSEYEALKAEHPKATVHKAQTLSVRRAI